MLLKGAVNGDPKWILTVKDNHHLIHQNMEENHHPVLKGYVKIMLKKKLNPIFPKNRKFVISLQN